MKYIIDHFEDEYAILENTKTKKIEQIKKSCLPSPIKEGTIITWDGENYIIDEEETDKKRQEILNKFQKLKNIS